MAAEWLHEAELRVPARAKASSSGVSSSQIASVFSKQKKLRVSSHEPAHAELDGLRAAGLPTFTIVNTH